MQLLHCLPALSAGCVGLRRQAGGCAPATRPPSNSRAASRGYCSPAIVFCSSSHKSRRCRAEVRDVSEAAGSQGGPGGGRPARRDGRPESFSHDIAPTGVVLLTALRVGRAFWPILRRVSSSCSAARPGSSCAGVKTSPATAFSSLVSLNLVLSEVRHLAGYGEPPSCGLLQALALALACFPDAQRTPAAVRAMQRNEAAGPHVAFPCIAWALAARIGATRGLLGGGSSARIAPHRCRNRAGLARSSWPAPPWRRRLY